MALAAGGARQRGDGWWAAPTVAAGLVLSIALGDHGGGILLGIAWAAVGFALRDAQANEPAAATT